MDFARTVFFSVQFPSPSWNKHEEERMDPNNEFLPLFLEHQVAVRAFIGSLVRDRHTRDDLFQEVALTLWHEFPRYDRARSFGAWARGIAANKVLQRWHKDNRLPAPFPPDAIQALLDACERGEQSESYKAEALEACLEQLPAKSRELLNLRYERSLKLGEIAQRLHSTLDAVHKALSRIRDRLAQCVERRLAATQKGS
jgi:RNA polymerase sigma-70 factor (ECF subfamily)